MKKLLIFLGLAIATFFLAACWRDSVAEIEERIKIEKDPETRTFLAEYARQLRLAKAGSKFDDAHALALSITFGDPENAEFFISKGADVNVSVEGMSMLHTAAFFCRPEIARMLIEKGADVNARNSEGETPLLVAVSKMSFDEDVLLGGLLKLTEDAKKDYERKKEEGPMLLSVLLENGADVNKHSRTGASPLSEAVGRSNAVAAEKLLKSGADIETTMPDGKSLIVKAVEENDIPMIDVLLAHGAKITEKHDDKSLLQIAFEAGDTLGKYNLASHLISHGADVNDVQLVVCLAGAGDVSSVKFLLDKGLNPKTKIGIAPLAYVVAHLALEEEEKPPDLRRQIVEVVKTLVTAGGDINFVNEDGLQGHLLGLAIKMREAGLVKFLLERGVDPNTRHGKYPVVAHACEDRGAYKDIVRLLVESGADVNVEWEEDSMMITLLDVATDREDLDLISYLLSHGADPNRRLKGVPLSVWATNISLDCVKLFADAGADINAESENGVIPLSLAIKKKNLDMVNYLLSKKADPNRKLKDLSNLPLVVYAVTAGLDFVKALHLAGADLNATSDRGESALSLAIKAGNGKMVEYLLENNKALIQEVSLLSLYPNNRNTIELLVAHGANINAQNEQSETLLFLAAERGDEDFLKYLLSHGADPNVGASSVARAYAFQNYSCARLLIAAGADATSLPGLPETIKIPGRNYAFGKYEVTQKQYDEVMKNNPSKFKGEDFPVENVSWNEAVEYCKKLTERERALGRISMNQEYRLPTSDEWEHACRAGTSTIYYTGDLVEDLACAGWYDKNSDDKTHPVGQKEPNAFGLYDMHGNVEEWTSTPDGSSRVCRGGCWDNSAFFCESSSRSYCSPENRYDYLGFRVVLSEVQ